MEDRFRKVTPITNGGINLYLNMHNNNNTPKRQRQFCELFKKQLELYKNKNTPIKKRTL